MGGIIQDFSLELLVHELMILLIDGGSRKDSLDYIVSILVVNEEIKVDGRILKEFIVKSLSFIFIDILAKPVLDEHWAFLVDWALVRRVLNDVKG